MNFDKSGFASYFEKSLKKYFQTGLLVFLFPLFNHSNAADTAVQVRDLLQAEAQAKLFNSAAVQDVSQISGQQLDNFESFLTVIAGLAQVVVEGPRTEGLSWDDRTVYGDPYRYQRLDPEVWNHIAEIYKIASKANQVSVTSAIEKQMFNNPGFLSGLLSAPDAIRAVYEKRVRGRENLPPNENFVFLLKELQSRFADTSIGATLRQAITNLDHERNKVNESNVLLMILFYLRPNAKTLVEIMKRRNHFIIIGGKGPSERFPLIREVLELRNFNWVSFINGLGDIRIKNQLLSIALMEPTPPRYAEISNPFQEVIRAFSEEVVIDGQNMGNERFIINLSIRAFRWDQSLYKDEVIIRAIKGYEDFSESELQDPRRRGNLGQSGRLRKMALSVMLKNGLFTQKDLSIMITDIRNGYNWGALLYNDSKLQDLLREGITTILKKAGLPPNNVGYQALLKSCIEAEGYYLREFSPQTKFLFGREYQVLEYTHTIDWQIAGLFLSYRSKYVPGPHWESRQRDWRTDEFGVGKDNEIVFENRIEARNLLSSIENMRHAAPQKTAVSPAIQTPAPSRPQDLGIVRTGSGGGMKCIDLLK